MLRRAVSGAVKNIKSAAVSIKISGKFDAPSLSIDSNIGRELASALKAAAGQELENVKKQAEGRLDDAIKPCRAEAESRVKEYENKLQDQLKAREKQVSDFQAEVQRKINEQKSAAVSEVLSKVKGKVKLPSIKF